MKSIFIFGTAAIVMAALPAHAERFANGKSYYGSPAPAGVYRTVDLSQKGPINIACGETVNFTSQGRTFAWKVSSIQHNHVPVARFAPPGFDTQGKSIFVMPGEHELGGRKRRWQRKGPAIRGPFFAGGRPKLRPPGRRAWRRSRPCSQACRRWRCRPRRCRRRHRPRGGCWFP